jgi:O-antigen ligase
MRSVSPIALLLWAGLWLNLNTGFWNIQAPNTSQEWLLLLRATLPFALLPLAVGVLLASRRKLRLPGFSPSPLLLTYGLLAAIASTFSPSPWHSLYWSVTFLATIATAWTFATEGNAAPAARQMLQVTWAATFVVAAIIAYTARGVVFSNAGSGYGIINNLDGLSRSSGVARWAAVPGLVCILKACHARRPAQIAFFLTAAGAAFFIVYRMQSRGAVIGSAVALLFALFTANRLRRYALPFLIFAAVVLPLLESPDVLSERVSEYLRRGQSEEQFLSMTGRTRAYEHGLAAFWDAPLLGRGQWADRIIIGEHIHNSYLQALLNGGLAGGIPYAASWIAGWVLFLRLQKRRRLLRPEDRTALLEAGTVMMFFTVRSIPETTTASFAVDLLVMAAVYVYFETLTCTLKSRIQYSHRCTPMNVGKYVPALARVGQPEGRAPSVCVP